MFIRIKELEKLAYDYPDYSPRQSLVIKSKKSNGEQASDDLLSGALWLGGGVALHDAFAAPQYRVNKLIEKSPLSRESVVNSIDSMKNKTIQNATESVITTGEKALNSGKKKLNKFINDSYQRGGGDGNIVKARPQKIKVSPETMATAKNVVNAGTKEALKGTDWALRTGAKVGVGVPKVMGTGMALYGGAKMIGGAFKGLKSLFTDD